ncbi:hypothetical protein [Photobacterium chitinilyticum]|uniref:Uncharacterized protein n=1 Tax=Photobacterium chitinilyticum TaxID=2485123 RepID=A0A444JQM0_9GAMM|nr:hypothetical protein [Photobacterium chitinilyticum]RWX55359.1 hypothetical protein EDI28_12405 [Photobacterium chitinilyticum]
MQLHSARPLFESKTPEHYVRLGNGEFFLKTSEGNFSSNNFTKMIVVRVTEDCDCVSHWCLFGRERALITEELYHTLSKTFCAIAREVVLRDVVFKNVEGFELDLMLGIRAEVLYEPQDELLLDLTEQNAKLIYDGLAPYGFKLVTNDDNSEPKEGRYCRVQRIDDAFSVEIAGISIRITESEATHLLNHESCNETEALSELDEFYLTNYRLGCPEDADAGYRLWRKWHVYQVEGSDIEFYDEYDDIDGMWLHSEKGDFLYHPARSKVFSHSGQFFIGNSSESTEISKALYDVLKSSNRASLATAEETPEFGKVESFSLAYGIDITRERRILEAFERHKAKALRTISVAVPFSPIIDANLRCDELTRAMAPLFTNEHPQMLRSYSRDLMRYMKRLDAKGRVVDLSKENIDWYMQLFFNEVEVANRKGALDHHTLVFGTLLKKLQLDREEHALNLSQVKPPRDAR